MHGLINWSIQSFVTENYGAAQWEKIAQDSELGFAGFEAMMTYEDELTYKMLDVTASRLGKPKEAILEDIGVFICTHPNLEAVRRLLRFGGDTFSDFLCSLDDLAERVHLALPDLEVPDIDLRLSSRGNVTMKCTGNFPGYGHVMVGVLQAIADDYGTLAVFEHLGRDKNTELISIQMMTATHSEGREFNLAQRAQ